MREILKGDDVLAAPAITTGTDLAIAGTYNARAVHVGSTVLPWIVRSASPDTLTAEGERALTDAGVDLILDLREPSEHGQRTHTLPVVSVPLYGTQPPAAGSLETIYRMLLAERGERLALAVATIADHHSGAVLVHCTAGKDRTGLVVALARLAAGDSREAVLDDYARSGTNVRPQRRELVAAQLAAQGLDAPGREADRAAAERLHLDSPAAALQAALDLIAGYGDDPHDVQGGAIEFLAAHGVTAAQLDALRTRAAGFVTGAVA